MIDKSQRQKILENIKDKDERLLLSNILDKATRYEKNDSVIVTNFLNLNELEISKKILNYCKINYTILSVNENIEKKNIAFIPSYLLGREKEILNWHVCCIKVVPRTKGKLLHKDYMGAIYSLGVRRELIGDIIVKDDIGYFFVMKSVEEYFLLNLTSVGKSEVETKTIDIYSDEVQNLCSEFVQKEYIVPSYRVDAILSETYNLSRNEVKEKIQKGDLYINDKNIFYPSTIVSFGDIISFRRCGKLKIAEEIRKTKNSNFVLKIYKYA